MPARSAARSTARRTSATSTRRSPIATSTDRPVRPGPREEELMTPLFAHHAHGFLEIEVMGREFPDGPTEHILVAVVAVVVLSLMAYGAFAAVRDLWRWRRQRPAEVPPAG